MFTYRFQSKLIQQEGILGTVAEASFDPALENYYNQLGASCNPQQWQALNFVRLLGAPQYTNYLIDCSVSGVADMLYGKTGINTQAPALWTMKGAPLKKALAQLKPYLSCAQLAVHLQIIKDIASRMNTTIPSEFIEALKASANNPVTVQSRTVMALTAILNHGLMIYRRPIRRGDAQTVSGYETCFITRDYNLIKQMAQNGLFSTSKDPVQNQADNITVMDRFEKALYGKPGTPWGTTTGTALEQGRVAAAKLTPQALENNQVYFDLTIPQGNIDISDPAVSVLPVTLMRCFTEGIISTIANNAMVEITSQGYNGDPDYVSKVTATPAVFEQAYSDCPDKAKVAERAYLPVGFGVRTCRLLLLNLESSIYGSKGYVKINPYDIKAIRPIDASQLNTSAHSLSPMAIYTTFEKSLNGLSYEQLVDVVRHIPTLARLLANTGKPIDINAVVSALPKVHYSEVLKYLISVDPNAIKTIQSVGTRTASDKTPLQGTLDERRKALEDLLANHYVAINYLSKEGLREIIATSNEQLLAAKLGTDYKLKYEGWFTQCQVIKNYILTASPTKQMVAEMIASYGIKYLDINALSGNTEAEIDAWIEAANASRPQRKASVPNPENISVRCIPAAPYFRTLKIPNIQGISVLDNV